ncbi:hypothetical protein ACFOMD_00405 [Sphingoaurantiacus capsulatus]|uniref:Uncharacterized protein n=1 Tax=Sphingoaurantiacus capsulatus TaxID=1771310 RepID=A0ABV7X7D4_9SPHN
MNRTFLLLAAVLLTAAPATAATLEDARAAYGLFDVNRAETLYREVAADPKASAKDRAAASRELARIAWLADADATKAAAILAASLPGDPDPCPAAQLRLRILNELSPTAPLPADAAALADKCVATDPGVALEGVRRFQLSAMQAPDRVRVAKDGLANLAALPEDARLTTQGTALQLALGLLAGDASAAIAGWRDWFWLKAGEGAPSAIGFDPAKVTATFTRGLAATSDPVAAFDLADLLVRAGFYRDARGYAERQGLAKVGGPRWQRLAVYFDFRDAIDREILAHDRLYARKGATEEEAYEKRLTAIVEGAAAKIDPKGKPMEVLGAAFGLFGTEPGRTNGVAGIHLGHVIVDEKQHTAQDGREGDIRFILLDNMVHNSFSGWLQDGGGQPGGWAVDGATIVQVRQPYRTGIDTWTRAVVPGPAREKLLAEIETQRPTDRVIAVAAGKEAAFLPGVRNRLRLAGLDGLAAQVRGRLKPGEDFAGAFRGAYWDTMVAYSITAHEGRHVLDQASYTGDCTLGNAELEYRAKLSEIRFATSPRLAFASIFSPLLGGTSGHGIANKRLIEEIVAWMAVNRGAVAAYDPAQTALEQLDRLTDAQLVAITTALDRAAITGPPCPAR